MRPILMLARPDLGPFALALALLTAGCAGSGDAASDGSLRVVAAFYPLEEAAHRIGGDRVDVTNLTPPGVEPHDIELAPDDLEAIFSADVVLYVGGGFQPALENATTQAGGEVVDVGEGLARLPPPADEEEHEGEPGGQDPHIWLDPELYGQIVARASRAMAAASPGDAKTFEANTAAFVRELAALDRRFGEGLASCRRRTIVVNHAAFGYLAHAYRLDQVGISGLSPQAEPDPARLAELARFVRENGVTTIFTEELVSPEVAEVLAREVGAKTEVLYTLEGLTDQQIAAGDGYVSVMHRNLKALRDALDCT